MRSSTMGIFLFAIAALALLSGMEWLAIVFGALGFGILFFYKQTATGVMNYPTENESAAYPGMQQPPQIVIVDQGGGHGNLAEQIEEHIMLEKALGGAHEREEEKHKKKLKKELKHLKHEIKHLHAMYGKGKKGQDDGHH